MSTRTDAGIKLWTPWPHIGRGSGELCIGRLCFDIHTDQTWRWWLFNRRPGRANPSHPAHRFAAYAFGFGPILIIVRRWR